MESGTLPTLCCARHTWGEDRWVATLAEGTSHLGGHASDQQRCGRHQLCDVEPGATFACLRPVDYQGEEGDRATGGRWGEDRHAGWRGAHSHSRDVGDS